MTFGGPGGPGGPDEPEGPDGSEGVGGTAGGVEDELLTFCAENEIGVVGYSPMCKGLLTGKYTRERAAALTADDHR